MDLEECFSSSEMAWCEIIEKEHQDGLFLDLLNQEVDQSRVIDSNSARLVQTQPTRDVRAIKLDSTDDLDDSQLLALVIAMEAELPLLYPTTHETTNEDILSSDIHTARTELPVSYSC